MRLAVWSLIATCTVGCTSVYRVSGSDKEGGIPFLPHESVDTSTLIYEQSWAELKVTVVRENPPSGKADKTPAADRRSTSSFVVRTLDVPGAVGLLNECGLKGTPLEVYDTFIPKLKGALSTELEGAPRLTTGEPGITIDIVSIQKFPLVSIERKRTVVASPNPLYFNSRVPFGGSNTTSVELGANGTLSKASAAVVDTFPGTALTTLGALAGAGATEALVSSLVGAPAAAEGEKGVRVVRAECKLDVVRRQYVVAVTKPTLEPACDLVKGLKAETGTYPCQVSLTIRTLRGDTSEQSQTKSQDGITFSGSVKLPESTDEKK